MAKRTPAEHRAIVEEIARKQRITSAKNKANVTHKKQKKRVKRGSVRANSENQANAAFTKQRIYDLGRFARE